MSAPSVGDLSVARTGASNTTERNGPEQASRQAPSVPLVPVPAIVTHPRSAEPWKDWDLTELMRFASEHPEAIATRTFEYDRRGFPLVEVSVPCLHHFDALGQMRVVTLAEATADGGRCRTCAKRYQVANDIVEREHVALGDACPTCHGTRRAPVHLKAGLVFMETQQVQWYWTLLKPEAQ